MTALTDLTIREAADRLRAGEISSVELTRAYLDRIAALDDTLQAYLTVTGEIALEQARRADERRAAGR